MPKTTIIAIIGIGILALGISIFQYLYKAKRNYWKQYLFAFLRFLSLFILGVLLLNPKIKQTTYNTIKPNLVVAIDNSASTAFLDHTKAVNDLISELNASELASKFDIDYYSFGTSFNSTDSLSFTERQTNIATVFPSLKKLYKNSIAPTIIVTDGNQTYGQDYVISSLTYEQPIYPIVLGDSIIKTDLKIQHIQHNKYAFLDNEFPVEITLSYDGKQTVDQEFEIYKGSSKVFTKRFRFSKENNIEIVNLNLPATAIGKQRYSAAITPIEGEKNTTNNKRSFSVEVIDERTNVLLVSDILHPDLGAVKKAIETNKQRNVVIAKPTENIDYNNYQLVIVYQPNSKFFPVFEKISEFDKNFLTITGLQTDWNFLNSIQQNFKRKAINQNQDYLSSYNAGFNLFNLDELDFDTFPPLKEYYGTIELNSSNVNTLLYQKINSITTTAPLLTFFEYNGKREGLLIGEGIWKWRAQSFMNNQNFESFDLFLGKIVQFLASNTKKERLVIDHNDEFNLGQAIFTAQYYDKNYVLDSNAKLNAKLVHQETKQEFNFDFLFKGNSYELNLSQLPIGSYEYIISVQNEQLSKKGSFEILDFNIEAQFLNADVTKLTQIATNKQTHYIADYDKLFKELMNNESYAAIQKADTKEKPLIDWYYLLLVLLSVLAIEWFMRKYNGLI